MTQNVLTENKKEEIRIELVSNLKKLNEELSLINNEIKDLHPSGPDVADQASAVEERNSLLSKVNIKTLNIRAIERTLGNFEDFGFCTDCGEDIDVKRLIHNHTVSRCIGCQEIFELKQKQLGK